MKARRAATAIQGKSRTDNQDVITHPKTIELIGRQKAAFFLHLDDIGLTFADALLKALCAGVSL